VTDDFKDLYTDESFDPYVDGAGVTIEDFRAYMPGHSYIFMPCRDIWPSASVNSRLGPQPVLDANGRPKRRKGKDVMISASAWLDQNRAGDCDRNGSRMAGRSQQ
jgi:hypothetical protein